MADAPTPQWEYCTARVPLNNLVDWLNKLGAQGWELTGHNLRAYNHDIYWADAIFKRRKEARDAD